MESALSIHSMNAALKIDFAHQSASTDGTDGNGHNGTFAQSVLYPAREGRTREEEIANAAQMTLEIAREQLQKAYTTSRTGRVYDLHVRLQYSDDGGDAEIVVTCANSLDQVVRKIKTELLKQQQEWTFGTPDPV